MKENEIMATATITTPRPPLPPFTRERATQKVRIRWLEHSRSGESSVGLRDRFTMEEPLGIHPRTNGNHCVPLSQMGKRVGLQAHQGIVGVHRQSYRRTLRLRVARRLRSLVSLLWQRELGI